MPTGEDAARDNESQALGKKCNPAKARGVAKIPRFCAAVDYDERMACADSRPPDRGLFGAAPLQDRPFRRGIYRHAGLE